jgi:hypothetical protein
MDLIQPLAAIVFVGGLLGGVLLLLRSRRAAAVSGGRHLEVIERVALGPQHALHLVRAGRRVVLIATAPSACHILDQAVEIGEKA